MSAKGQLPVSFRKQFLDAFGIDTTARIVAAAYHLAELVEMQPDEDSFGTAFGSDCSSYADDELKWALSRVMRHGDLGNRAFCANHGIAPNYGEFLVWMATPERTAWLGKFDYAKYECEIKPEDEEGDDYWEAEYEEWVDPGTADDVDDEAVVKLDIPRWMPHG